MAYYHRWMLWLVGPGGQCKGAVVVHQEYNASQSSCNANPTLPNSYPINLNSYLNPNPNPNTQPIRDP